VGGEGGKTIWAAVGREIAVDGEGGKIIWAAVGKEGGKTTQTAVQSSKTICATVCGYGGKAIWAVSVLGWW